MDIYDLELEGVKILTPKYFKDNRGYYCETYSARTLKEVGIDTIFVQDNHIFSKVKGIIRGIHFQNNPKSQIKLGRCTKGKVLDYIIDLRKDSSTFKKWTSIELSQENKKQVFIPNGFGHAFITLEDDCEFQYKVSEFYEPNFDRAIAWNDPEIDIKWPCKVPILSEKDKKAPFLKDSDVNFIIGG